MRSLRTSLPILLSILALFFCSAAFGQKLMDVKKAETTRFEGSVMTWYGSHFEHSAAHDWVPIKDWNGPYHPMLGDYKTDDRKVVRQHLQWLRRAGIDVILYDTCRIQPEMTLLDIEKQKTLQILVEELSHQEKETRKLKLVIWMEKWNSNPTVEQYRFGLDYVKKNLADRDFYFRLNDKPMIVTYLNRPDPEIDKIDREYEKHFTMRRITPTPDMPGWLYIGVADNKECMTANPGIDTYLEEAFIAKIVNKKPIDEKTIREHGKIAIEQRADGKYFEKQLLQVREANPKLIFISGWNDWACCLQIEPAKEYEFKYVDLAARLLGREAETKPYRETK